MCQGEDELATAMGRVWAHCRVIGQSVGHLVSFADYFFFVLVSLVVLYFFLSFYINSFFIEEGKGEEGGHGKMVVFSVAAACGVVLVPTWSFSLFTLVFICKYFSSCYLT